MGKTIPAQNYKYLDDNVFLDMRGSLSFVLALALLMPAFLETGLATAPTPIVPEAPGIGTVYIEGDWDVYGVTGYANKTIYLRGNLTIHSGGMLSLANCDLRFDCSEDMEFMGEVKNGGTFQMADSDGDAKTTSDYSEMTTNDGVSKFKFVARRGSKISVKNSNISLCGASPTARGFYVETDDATFNSVGFVDCYAGLSISGCNPSVRNCTFQGVQYGLYLASANPTIANCTVFGPSGWGVQALSSTPQITGMTIERGMGGIYLLYSSPTLRSVKVINSASSALYCWKSSPTIYDSSFFGSTGIQALFGSYPGLVNTSFDETRIIVGNGAHVSAGRYVNVSVMNSSGLPAICATVSIVDSEGLVSWWGVTSFVGTARGVERTCLYTCLGKILRGGGRVYAYAEDLTMPRVEVGESPVNATVIVFMQTSSPTIEYDPYDVSIGGDAEVTNMTLIFGGDLIIEPTGSLEVTNVTMLFDTSSAPDAGLRIMDSGMLTVESCTVCAAHSPRPMQSSSYSFVAEQDSNVSIRNSTIVSAFEVKASTDFFKAPGTAFLHAKSDALRFDDAVCSPGALLVESSQGGISATGCTLDMAGVVVRDVAGNGFTAYSSYGTVSNFTASRASYGAYLSSSRVTISDSSISACSIGVLAAFTHETSVEGTSIADCGSTGVMIMGGRTIVSGCTLSGSPYGIDDGGESLWVEASTLGASTCGFMARSRNPVVSNSTISSPCDVQTERGAQPALLNCTFSEGTCAVVDSSFVSVGGFAGFNVQLNGTPVEGAVVSLGDGFSSAVTGVDGSSGWLAFCDHRLTADGVESRQPVQIFALSEGGNESRHAAAPNHLAHGSWMTLDLPPTPSCIAWPSDRLVTEDEVHVGETLVLMADVVVAEGGRLELDGCDVRFVKSPSMAYGLMAVAGDIAVRESSLRPLVARSPGAAAEGAIASYGGTNLTIEDTSLSETPAFVYGRAAMTNVSFFGQRNFGIYAVNSNIYFSGGTFSYCGKGVEAWDSKISMSSSGVEHSVGSGLELSGCDVDVRNVSARANDYGVKILDGSVGLIERVDMDSNAVGTHIFESDFSLRNSTYTANRDTGLHIQESRGSVSAIRCEGNGYGARVFHSIPTIDGLTSVSNQCGIHLYESAPIITNSTFDGDAVGIQSYGRYVVTMDSFDSGLDYAIESFIDGGSEAHNSFSIPSRARLLSANLSVVGTELSKVAVTLDTATQMSPVIWDDIIVYADNQNATWDIYAYNLSVDSDGDGLFNYMEFPHPDPDPAITRITDDEALDYNPVIYGSTIVWARYDDATGYDIYAHDLRNGTTWLVLGGAASDQQPSLWGGTMAWVGYEKFHEVYAWDFANGSSRRLSNNTNYNFGPDIYGDKVTWYEYNGDPYSEEANIHVVNLTTGEERLIQPLPSLQSLPSIWGDMIAFQDDREGDTNHDGWNEWDIYIYNMATGEETQLTEDDEASFAPEISGDTVVWYWHNRTLDDAIPETIEGWSVMMYNITSGERSILEAETSGDPWPVVHGRRVAWVNRTEGAGDIHVYDPKYSGYPSNATVDIGDDGILEWSESGQQIGLAPLDGQKLASAISSRLYQNELDETVTFPVRMSSNTLGRLKLVDMDIRYELLGIGENISFSSITDVGLNCQDSDFRLVNSSFSPGADEVCVGSGSCPELLNCSIERSFRFEDKISNITISNFLHVLALNVDEPVPGVDVQLYDGGVLSVAGETGPDGRLEWTRLRHSVTNSTTVISKNWSISVGDEPMPFVSDERRISMEKSHTEIFYADLPPVCEAGLDRTALEGIRIWLDGTLSTDDVGILWYNWSFGDCHHHNYTGAVTSHVYSTAGTYLVTLEVIDYRGHKDTDTCTVVVENVAPSADAGSDIVGNEGHDVVFDAGATSDTATDIPGLKYVWLFGDGCSATGINVSHAYADDGVYNAVLTVTDGDGAADTDEVEVAIENVAPVLEPISNKTAVQGVPFHLLAVAADVQADTLTFTGGSGLFDIDPATGEAEFTPTNDEVGAHEVCVTVTDDDGGSDSVTFTINVLNVNDPPEFQQTAIQMATEDVTFSMYVHATDPDEGDTVTYALISAPEGMALDNQAGKIIWTPGNGDVGTSTIVVAANDARGGSSSQSFDIAVANANDAPAFAVSLLPFATEDAAYAYAVVALDIDAGDVPTYEMTDGPGFLTMDAATGLLEGTPSNADVGTHEVSLTASDGMATATQSFELTVANVNDAPSFVSQPRTHVEAGSIYTYGAAAVDEDACDLLSYSLLEGPSGMVIGADGTVSWAPSVAHCGTRHVVIIQVSDGEAADYQVFHVDVSEPPAAAAGRWLDGHAWVGIGILLACMAAIPAAGRRRRGDA
jgi:beta propeller repeat protein